MEENKEGKSREKEKLEKGLKKGINRSRKTGRKFRIALVVCFCLMLAAAGGRILYACFPEPDQEDVPAAGDGEKLLYARVEAVTGNELLIMPTDADGGQTEEKESASRDFSEEVRDRGERKAPDGENGEAGMIREGSMGGGRLSGENMGAGRGLEEGADAARMPVEDSGADRTIDENVGTDRGGSRTLQIPVGTPVVTRLGAVTTFSRLAAGESIAVLMEEETENILKVWILS